MACGEAGSRRLLWMLIWNVPISLFIEWKTIRRNVVLAMASWCCYKKCSKFKIKFWFWHITLTYISNYGDILIPIFKRKVVFGIKKKSGQRIWWQPNFLDIYYTSTFQQKYETIRGLTTGRPIKILYSRFKIRFGNVVEIFN